jgi:tRNA uridine 5-carboxymethylaminomethyl modification enzyme
MKFDTIVVGGGHAGIEAAYICAKLRLSVLLITSHIDLIGQMSCNPSIGGIAKGNIVREIDALGGIMGKIIDKTGIHFKMLNQTKGIAVWGNRAQADKKQYRKIAYNYLESLGNINILQGMVEKINEKNGKAVSILMNSGEEIKAGAIILCMGTFLNGIAHIGLNSFQCGRLGEPSSLKITESINNFGIVSSRLKTGTSPRIDGRSVDFTKMSRQIGDEYPWPFSYSTEILPENKTSCWITKTTNETHKIIRDNLDRSPLYQGIIKGKGPRYCPSIEDKVVRFGDRDGHTLFLEPEGLDTQEMYLNGLSTSLPFDVQTRMVKSISGLENAHIIRPGYAIEYDYFQPKQLNPTLESKTIKNLFFAGQINGTSGYEEAASQGIIAGINAYESLREEKYLILGRETSYIGVLIDDLVTKGTEEPYRMFTSRAEHRLLLRQDNSDERLMRYAYEKGLIEEDLFNKRRHIWEKKEKYKEYIFNYKVKPTQWNNEKRRVVIQQKITLHELLKRPEISIDDIEEFFEDKIESREIKLGVEADIKYSGFLEKEKEMVEKYRKFENLLIPESMNYEKLNGLLTESRLKLIEIKPKSLGQASRIPGVTPADISILMGHLLKNKIVSRETVDL